MIDNPCRGQLMREEAYVRRNSRASSSLKSIIKNAGSVNGRSFSVYIDPQTASFEFTLFDIGHEFYHLEDDIWWLSEDRNSLFGPDILY